MLELYAEMGGRAESTLLPIGPRVPTLNAVSANGYVTNILDFDDTLNGHPGACVIPTALALGERLGASGADVLQAIVLGYEVETRIGDALRPSPERWRQVSGSATFLAFGSAAAAASLLQFDADRTASALGLAGASAPVPYIRKFGFTESEPLSWAKNNYGWAAASGLFGALLVERGFVGSRTILDGPRGFWVMAGSDRCDWLVLTADLGKDYRICRASFKPYSCCRYLHGILDAFAQAAGGLRPDEIDKVETQGFYHIAHFMDTSPRSMFDAQFSVPFAVAAVGHGIPPGFPWFSPETLANPSLLSLAQRVTFEPNSAYDGPTAYGGQVTVRSGKHTRTAAVPYPRGHPSNPLSEEELVAKFHSLVDPVLGMDRALELLDAIERVETLADIRTLTRILGGQE
jgi:2-methylcitrate dehydratase PrpD